LTYLTGVTHDGGFLLTPKCFGNPRPMVVAVSTLATDRALLFLCVPRTAKNRVS
jgi:hypothetical protein